MYWEMMLEDYLLELNLRNYSDRTIKSVRNTSRLFFKWLQSEFGINEIEQVKKPHIKAYLQYKQEQGLSPLYINGRDRDVIRAAKQHSVIMSLTSSFECVTIL